MRPDHRDRCWLDPEQKREKRQVEGQIGLEAPRMSDGGEPLLEVTDLVKHFPVKRGLLIDREVDQVRAVDGDQLQHPPAARRSAWSASPAAASRPPAARCCS